MIRNIALWLMYFYADDDRPMPTWLRRWIDSDPKLSERARRYASLEQQLRESAHERVGRTTHQPSSIRSAVARTNHRSARSMVGLLALAAGLLLLIAGGVAVMQNGVWWIERPSGREVAIKDPATGSKFDEETRKRIQTSALAAKQWMDRSIKKSETAPAIAMAALDIKVSQELTIIREQLGDATRFFAVKLPLAGRKLLGAVP